MSNPPNPNTKIKHYTYMYVTRILLARHIMVRIVNCNFVVTEKIHET